MPARMDRADTLIAVLAHNEERRIARCLASLPLAASGIAVHAVVNGSTDRTAEIARGFASVTVHEYAEGGKSKSWNRFVLDTPGIEADVFVFVDGDAEISAAIAWIEAAPCFDRNSRIRAWRSAGMGMLRPTGRSASIFTLGLSAPSDVMADPGSSRH